MACIPADPSGGGRRSPFHSERKNPAAQRVAGSYVGAEKRNQRGASPAGFPAAASVPHPPPVRSFLQRKSSVLKGQRHIVGRVVETIEPAALLYEHVFHHGMLAGPIIHIEKASVIGEVLALEETRRPYQLGAPSDGGLHTRPHATPVWARWRLSEAGQERGRPDVWEQGYSGRAP